jgi:hypothetical protein
MTTVPSSILMYAPRGLPDAHVIEKHPTPTSKGQQQLEVTMEVTMGTASHSESKRSTRWPGRKDRSRRL